MAVDTFTPIIEKLTICFAQQVADSTFMVALGALTSLTQLSMRVSAEPRAQPFVINLAALSQLKHLQVLLLCVCVCLLLCLFILLCADAA